MSGDVPPWTDADIGGLPPDEEPPTEPKHPPPPKPAAVDEDALCGAAVGVGVRGRAGGGAGVERRAAAARARTTRNATLAPGGAFLVCSGRASALTAEARRCGTHSA